MNLLTGLMRGVATNPPQWAFNGQRQGWNTSRWAWEWAVPWNV